MLEEEEAKGDKKDNKTFFEGGSPRKMCRDVDVYGRNVDCIKIMNAVRNLGLVNLGSCSKI